MVHALIPPRTLPGVGPVHTWRYPAGKCVHARAARLQVCFLYSRTHLAPPCRKACAPARRTPPNVVPVLILLTPSAILQENVCTPSPYGSRCGPYLRLLHTPGAILAIVCARPPCMPPCVLPVLLPYTPGANLLESVCTCPHASRCGSCLRPPYTPDATMPEIVCTPFPAPPNALPVLLSYAPGTTLQ